MMRKFFIGALIALFAYTPVLAQTANGRVTTAVPSYTDNTAAPLSLTPSGQLRSLLTGPIPAGTNNIGDVDVLTLPSIPAGANNIGNVGVTSLPSIPAGANTIGSVGISGSIPAGTNNIGDVDVLTLPSIPAGSNAIGSVSLSPISSRATNNSLSTTANNMRTSGGVLYWVTVAGNASAATVINLYDNATTCTGTILFAATAQTGVGFAVSMPQPVTFTNGITGCASVGTVSVSVGTSP